MNGLLAAAVSRPHALADEVERPGGSCREVRVLLRGPWTAFLRFQSRLAGTIRQVVAQNLPRAGVPTGRLPGFTCRYDLLVCRQINETLGSTGIAVRMDVPRNLTLAYAPTAEVIEQLVPKGFPGTARPLILANRDAWREALMRDDSAAP